MKKKKQTSAAQTEREKRLHRFQNNMDLLIGVMDDIRPASAWFVDWWLLNITGQHTEWISIDFIVRDSSPGYLI